MVMMLLSVVPLFSLLFSVSIGWLFFVRRISRRRQQQQQPPSPPRLPIIGNIHQVGKFPHRSLASLSERYGPLMLLRIGSVPTLVVSSAESAQDVLKTHDLDFSDRHPFSILAKEATYEMLGVVFSPYGDYWRKLRTILTGHLLSNTRVHSLRILREEETALLVKKIRDASSSPLPIDLTSLFSLFMNDVICRGIFGKKYSEGERGMRFRQQLTDYLDFFSAYDPIEFSSWLKWINHLNGKQAKAQKVSSDIDCFLEQVIEEHLYLLEIKIKETIEEGDEGTDLLIYRLLKLHKDNNDNSTVPIDRETIKAFLLDILGAGIDAVSTLLEWTMSELFRNPMVMNKLQNEVREIIKDKETIINDEDISKMQYLKLVMKETLRLHPPNPLLVPHGTRQDVNVSGYHIPAGTMVLVNVWMIGRDSAFWEDPKEFRPERFLNSSVDFTGKDFWLLPFGAGRRICPGISFAMATYQLLLASLLSHFDWKLPSGMKAEDLDMTEVPGITSRRRTPLYAIAAIPCSG